MTPRETLNELLRTTLDGTIGAAEVYAALDVLDRLENLPPEEPSAVRQKVEAPALPGAGIRLVRLEALNATFFGLAEYAPVEEDFTCHAYFRAWRATVSYYPGGGVEGGRRTFGSPAEAIEGAFAWAAELGFTIDEPAKEEPAVEYKWLRRGARIRLAPVEFESGEYPAGPEGSCFFQYVIGGLGVRYDRWGSNAVRLGEQLTEAEAIKAITEAATNLGIVVPPYPFAEEPAKVAPVGSDLDQLFAAFVEWRNVGSRQDLCPYIRLFGDGSGRMFDGRGGEWGWGNIKEGVTKIKAMLDK